MVGYKSYSSHDERLLKMVCQELWVCSKGKVGQIYKGKMLVSNTEIGLEYWWLGEFSVACQHPVYIQSLNPGNNKVIL